MLGKDRNHREQGYLDRGHGGGASLGGAREPKCGSRAFPAMGRLLTLSVMILPVALLAGCDGGESDRVSTPVSVDVATGSEAQREMPSNNPGENEMRQELSARFGDDGALRLQSGALEMSVVAGAFRPFGDHVQHCESGCEITISRGDAPPQKITLGSLYLDTQATFLRGSLVEGEGKGHSLVVTDVDGDGQEDLIVWTGLEGAYGGPSYDVYLYRSGGGYIHSQEISDLTLGASALFTIEAGRLKVPSKDGCCFHAYDTYELSDGVPTLIERITEDSSGEGPPVVRTQRLVGGELKEVASED